VAALVVALLSLGGGSSTPSSAGSTASTSASGTRAHAHTKHVKTSAAGSSTKASSGVSRSEVNVVVLNGTETNNLAHRTSGELQQHGYTQAAALAGHPPGSNQTTAVEYASGHRADAEGVASTLGVSRVEPLEAGVGSLAGSANVVVVVGADRAG